MWRKGNFFRNWLTQGKNSKINNVQGLRNQCTGFNELKIVHLNVQSILNKQESPESFLEAEKVDILCVSQHHLHILQRNLHTDESIILFKSFLQTYDWNSMFSEGDTMAEWYNGLVEKVKGFYEMAFPVKRLKQRNAQGKLRWVTKGIRKSEIEEWSRFSGQISSCGSFLTH